MNTFDKVKNYIKEKSLLMPGDRVVMGVSGGADSVCLFLILCELRESLSLSLYCVCVNHGIRPEAAEEVAYVEQLSRDKAVPFYSFNEDVPAFADSLGISEEEAGRIKRYEAFKRVANEVGANRIAVAHNMNDNSETMLFNLFRGSALSGLSGIAPKREEIIRPILCLKRAEIEAYLNEKNVQFFTDRTNDEDTYTRNRIRHTILPFAEEKIVKNVDEHLFSTAENIREADDYITKSALEAKERCLGERDNQLIISKLLSEHPAVAKKLIYLMLVELSPGKKDITSGYVKDVLNLCEGTGSGKISLAFGINVRREYNTLIFDVGEAEKSLLKGQLRICDLEESKRIIDSKTYVNSSFIYYIDYDKIKSPVEFRTRKEGDFIFVKSGGGLVSKTVKSIFINDKVPKEERDLRELLVSGSEVLVIPGGRVSEKVKIDCNTKLLLEVRYERES